MSPITLSYPVHTFDHRILLQPGVVLSAKTLNALISSKREPSHRTLSLLRYGTVREDLLQFFSLSPCRTIFDSRERIAELLDLMRNIRLVLPLLQSLEYFKKHDFYTYRHSLMVASFATLLVKDLVTDYLDRILETATGPTHDFGKICVPLSVLRKTSPLTRTERGVIEHHAAAGYVLLAYCLQDTKHIAARVSRDHHERKDRSGYPRGIRLADKMVEIVSVCDVYDALISPRPYRPTAYENRTALEEITRMAELNQIRWESVRGLIALNRRSRPHHLECTVARTKRGTPPADNLYGVIADEE